jgi:hypothetical protein
MAAPLKMSSSSVLHPAQNVVELGPSPRRSAKSESAISTRVRAAVNFSVRPVQCGAARLKTLRAQSVSAGCGKTRCLLVRAARLKTLRAHDTRAQAHSYRSLLSEDRRRPQEAKTQTGRRETRRFCGETRNEKSESARRGEREHEGSVGKREGSVGKREERECAQGRRGAWRLCGETRRLCGETSTRKARVRRRRKPARRAPARGPYLDDFKNVYPAPECVTARTLKQACRCRLRVCACDPPDPR